MQIGQLPGLVRLHTRKLFESADYLRRALAKRPDPEVAAHLGEVLWKMGEREAANKVWRDALTDSPAHPLLTETMKRVAR